MTPDDLTELHEILIEQSEIKEGYIYLQISVVLHRVVMHTIALN